MSSSKYEFYIETGGEEASGYEDRYCWVCYGAIVAEGDTLEELLDSAMIDLVDQDGGSVAEVEADADWMVEAVKTEYAHVKGAREAGIPESVIQGKTKLTDHFSKEYINWKSGKEGKK